MQEIAECAHDVQRVLNRQTVEQRFQLEAHGRDRAIVSRALFAAAKTHRRLPDMLDQLERIGADLIADHLSQQTAQQPARFA